MGRDGGLVVGGDTVVGNGRKENSIKNSRSLEVGSMENQLRSIKSKIESLEQDPNETAAEFKSAQREAIQAVGNAVAAVNGLR